MEWEFKRVESRWESAHNRFISQTPSESFFTATQPMGSPVCMGEEVHVRACDVCVLFSGWLAHGHDRQHPISNTKRYVSSQMHTSVDGKPLFHAGCGTRRLSSLCDKPFRADDSKYASV